MNSMRAGTLAIFLLASATVACAEDDTLKTPVGSFEKTVLDDVKVAGGMTISFTSPTASTLRISIRP